MKGLDRRLALLEAACPLYDEGGGVDLDGLSVAELEQLERIIKARDAGTAIVDMPTEDLRFLAALRCI